MNSKATPPKKVIVNGRQFDSITKAAFALGIRRTEVSKAVKTQKSTTVKVFGFPGQKSRQPKEKVVIVKSKRGKKKIETLKTSKPKKKTKKKAS